MHKFRAILYLLVAKHWVLTISVNPPTETKKGTETWFRSENSLSLTSSVATKENQS